MIQQYFQSLFYFPYLFFKAFWTLINPSIFTKLHQIKASEQTGQYLILVRG